MGEILVQPPSILEEEPQVEVVNQDAVERLSFPKLDGILFPTVVENADVVASCPWMGGDEVSLTVALNNYYQPMTEESADEVIADVQAFLASQARNEEKKIHEPEIETLASSRNETSKDETEPDSTAHRRVGDDENISLEKRPYIQLKSTEPLVAVEAIVNTPDLVEESVEATASDAMQTAREPAKETPVYVKDTAIMPEEVPPEIMTDMTDEVSVVAPVDAIPDIDQPTASIAEEVPEVNFEVDNTDIARVNMPHDTVLPDDEVELENLRQREEMTDKIAEIISDTPEPMEQMEAVVDYETEPELPIVYDDRSSDSENEESFTDRVSAQTNDLESPALADPAVEKIEQLLAELAHAEDDQEMAESEGNEVAENEAEPQKDLQALYTELLDNMQLIRRPEFEDLLRSLAVELELEDEAGILEKLEEIEDPVLLRKVVYKTIKALATTMTTAKKTLTGIGRSALRLHAIEPLEGYGVT